MPKLKTWGLVSTVKAPADQVLAFVAHHLSLGASRLWIYLDDPADPVFDALSDIPGVTAVRCDDAHWQGLGGRPERHQNRQSKNAQAAYKTARKLWKLHWLGHIDVDEFIWADRPVAAHLTELPREQVMLRMEPFEAIHDPDLPDDIFTATRFRGALRPRDAALRALVLGPYAGMMTDGLLSHSQGKAFFRTGIKGLQPRLHGAFIKGLRLPGPDFQPGLSVLHFHAQDRDRWQAALPFRLTRGAYQYNPALQAHLSGTDAAGIADFYAATQMLTAEKLLALQGSGRLIEARLGLRDKLAALLARG